MFKICLLTMLWTVAPPVIDRAEPAITTPIATCARPVANVIQPGTVSALAPSELADAEIIEKRLRNWEAATIETLGLNRSQREKIRRQVQENVNEHSAVAVEQLTGQVNAERLLETYGWRIVERSRSHVLLEAIPRDETERLFYQTLRVSIKTDEAIPEKIAVVCRNQTHRIVWQSPKERQLDVLTVNFENEIPPAPRSLLRTADARENLQRATDIPILNPTPNVRDE